jgi:GcrA cell cycle regulator
MTWSSKRADELVKLWGLGLTADQIVEVFGDVTRSAVLGKIMRLRGRMELRSRLVRTNAARVIIREERKMADKAAKRPNGFYGATSQPPPPKKREPGQNAVTFGELGAGQCKFPYGERDFLFCGEPAVPNSPYCAACARVCYA